METRARVALIGLGAMGSRMARRMLGAGWPLAVFDVRAESVAALAEEGAQGADSARQATEGAELVILMVQNTSQAHQALGGPDGALAGMSPATVLIVMCTLAPGDARGIEQLAAAHQVEVLDAPVSGGTPGAQGGTLSIMVGGSDQRFQRCQALLETLGSRVYHVGPNVGDGQSAKMVNQLLCGVHLAAAAEALVLARKAGLDQSVMLDIVSNSAAGSWMIQNRAHRMVSRSFDEVHSYLALLAKDMGIVIDGAAAVSAPTPIAAAARETYKAGTAMGLNNQDDSVIIQVYERLAGL